MSFSLQYVLQFLLHLATLMVHAALQPYKKRTHNITNAIIFTCLVIISGINLYQYHVASQHLDGPVKFFYYTQFGVIMVPSMIMLFGIYESQIICRAAFKLKCWYNKYCKKYTTLDDKSTNQKDPENDKEHIPLFIWSCLFLLCLVTITLVIFAALIDVFCAKCNIVAKLILVELCCIVITCSHAIFV